MSGDPFPPPLLSYMPCRVCHGAGRLYVQPDHPECGACALGIGGPHPHELPNGAHLHVPICVLPLPDPPPPRKKRNPNLPPRWRPRFWYRRF